MSLTDRLRQPEYIGENRCTPCTVVNIAIAAGASALAAVASTVLGAGVFALSLGTIYLRGYLVPGTPTLTKRYLPERVLRWFDKDAATPTTDVSIEIDPSQVLLNIRAVEPCCEGTDLCLTSEFREAWREHIQTARAHGPSEDRLVTALGVPPGDDRISFDRQGKAFIAYTDDAVIGQWSSQAAVVADVAAATELDSRTADWADLAPAEVARVLMSLRVFIEQCPKCDGLVEVDQEVVESCCRSYDVIASACQDCDARLFEMEWDHMVDDAHTQPDQPAQVGA